ncbi:MAG: N-ethylammeline chlorohydrolase [Actinomycetes bacterium]|nr:MAG: N-ethylammeline chlorohydrolase [Actinomycetes bacterium]
MVSAPVSASTVPDLLIAGCDVLPGPGEERRAVDVEIGGGRISSIVDAGSAGDGSAERIDGTGLLAIPGLVNAHTHSPENCLRGIGEGLALEPWLLRMFGSSGPYTPQDHYDCALAGAVEMLELGVTGVVDHLWMTPPSVEAVDAAMRAYRDIGIRATVAPLMDDHDYTEDFGAAIGADLGIGGMSHHVALPPAEELVAQLRESLASWHGAEGDRLRILAGPGGVQWASEELLAGLAAAAREHGAGIHIHLLETTLQDRVCRHRFGCSAVEALDRLGILAPDCSLPHSVWTSDGDVELIAASGAIPVHNPAANLRLGSGRAPIRALLEAGAVVALGTDGSASSDNQNLWEALRLASLIHNDAAAGRWLTSSATLAMATSGGAAVIGRNAELGRLAVGAIADLALIDRRGDGVAGSVDTTAALALSESGRGVRHVIVDGRPVVRDGRCVTVDRDAARARLAEQAARRSPTASRPPDKTRRAMEEMMRFRGTAARLTDNEERETT